MARAAARRNARRIVLTRSRGTLALGAEDHRLAKILGSAYCLIFWIQNVGLCLVPLLIGEVLDATGGYTVPMVIFSSFGVLAFIFSFFLKIEDRRKGYGLELPNIKK